MELDRPAPLKVLHVLDVLSLSGMEYGVIKLVNGLDPKRFEPLVCCLRFQREVTVPLLRDDVPVIELRKTEGWDWRLVGKLARLVQEHRVDVIHSHNWSTFVYTVLAARRARRPIVIHGEHGREAAEPPWKRTLLSRYLAHRVSRVTTVSRDLARELTERWKIRPERVTAIPNGVDLERFAKPHDLAGLRAELDLPAEVQIVLSVGRLRPVKDHATLLRAFGEVHRTLPQTRLLLLGGDFGTGTRSGLVRLAQELGIADATRFLGLREDVPRLLQLADVYVNSSLYEGMSNTILEAMASGLPVVATAVGGNPELVEDERTGFLVPPRDPPALAARFSELLTSADLRTRMGRQARERVERSHALSTMVDNYSRVYEECHWRDRVLARGRRPRQLKPLVARGLRWTGLNRIRGSVGAPALTILTYHRVLPLPEALDSPFQAMVMPRDEFEAQMAYVSRECNVLTLEEAVRRIRQRCLPRRAVAVTFDDGYADNYTHAWPVLKTHGVPATFFVVTGLLDRTVSLWWEEVGEILRSLAEDRKTALHGAPDWMARTIGELNGPQSVLGVARQLVDQMNELPAPQRARALEILRDHDGDRAGSLSELALSWDQLREMADSGMQFGAHTVTHAFMDEIDEDQARREIEDSIATLGQRLGQPVRCFSYPRGRFSETAEQMLKHAGIEVAVTTVSGRNPAGCDVLRLKRLDAGYCRSRDGFDRALFEAELQGWFHRVRRG